jgi:hypothetical protein
MVLLSRFFEGSIVEPFVWFVDHLVAFAALDATRILRRFLIF